LRVGRIRLGMVNCTMFEFHILKIEFWLGIDLKASPLLESYRPFDFGLHTELRDKVSFHGSIKPTQNLDTTYAILFLQELVRISALSYSETLGL